VIFIFFGVNHLIKFKIISFRFVIPDEPIREILANKSGVKVPDKWIRNDLVKEIQSKMEDHHYVILPGHDPELRFVFYIMFNYLNILKNCILLRDL
jgi:hypothetical protein